ncbi:MAG: hypothetical protein C5B51_13370 [Terriglobia bacterium]|nr:MAG: hypothetical protein C5B51_13370 [Terriglobia bacterium]
MLFRIRYSLVNRPSARLSLSAAIACLCFSAALFGQTLGEITGDVRDASGGVIVGAAIQVTNTGTGAQRTTTSNASGVYTFPSLQPGTYNIGVSLAGFQSITRNGLELQVQQTARVDFALELGQTSQTVNVSAGAPLLTTENATVGSVIENKRIVDLPLNGRNFLQLVSLSPNVTSGFGDNASASRIVGGDRAQQNISVAGARSEFNHFTLDGVENTDPDFNTYVFLPSIDALDEFKVQTGVYPAEFGRGVGQVNVSTKAGTNSFHGAVFEFLRNDAVDSKSYAFVRSAPRNPFKWNQFGFTLGGPIRIPKVFDGRNHLFFLSNYEGFRLRQSAQNSYSVPTAAMDGGNFSGLPTIYDPATRVQQGGVITATPFANNIIPPTQLNAKSVKLLQYIPVPNINTGSSFSSNLLEADPTTLNKDQFTQRIDFVESAKSSWYGRYSWGSESQRVRLIGSSGSTIGSQPRQEMISNSRILSASIVNEFRFSHIGFANLYIDYLGNVKNVTAELGIPGVAPPPIAWGIPALGINTFSTVGDSVTGPYTINDHMFQWVDNLSWTKGKHSVRFGAEVRRDRFNTIGNATQRGSFFSNGTATENPMGKLGYSAGSGTAMADFTLGYLNSATLALGAGFGQFRSTAQNYYVDDSWRISRTLTISMGLRYEYVPPYADKSQHLINLSVPLAAYPGLVNPTRDLHPTLVRLGQGEFYKDVPFVFNPAINVARDGRLGTSGIQDDKTNFAPRIGIAWSPTNRWTFRSGAGMFYVQDIASFYLDASRNLTGSEVVTGDTNFPNLTLNNPFAIQGNALPVVSTPKVLGMQTNRRTPYSIQYLLNIQRELTKDTVLEVGYLGSESHKLQSWVPDNEPQPSTVGTAASRAPFPELSTQGWIMSSLGNANYQSLTARLQRRLSQGLTFMTSYSWSKSIDLSSGARNHSGEQQFPQTGYCLQCERGLSVFNVAHRFVTSALYELPFGRGKTLLDRGGVVNVFLGGWQINAILTLQTGTPATIIAGYDAGNRGYSAPVDRPNSTGVNAAFPKDQQTANGYFNTAAFARVTPGTLGNVGRNTLIGPGIVNLDSSLFKSFRVREQQQVQFRFETFNLPNHPNFGLPDVSLTSATFGKIRTTNTNMRSIQFGLKYLF